MKSLVLQPQGHSYDLNFHSEEEEEEGEREGDLGRVSTSGQVCASNICWAKWGFWEARAATGEGRGRLPGQRSQRRHRQDIAQWVWKRSLEDSGCPSMKTQVRIPGTHIIARHGDCTCSPRTGEAGTENDREGSSRGGASPDLCTGTHASTQTCSREHTSVYQKQKTRNKTRR